jgi:hypothetical protein
MTQMPPQKKGQSDHFQTPPLALAPLLPYLQPGWTIWEPSCGQGSIVCTLREKGYRVQGTDLLTGDDFLTWEGPHGYDAIVTNPPYSIKNDFLARCYALEKPFALLMPYRALETPFRQSLYRQHGVEVIFMDQRIEFLGKKGVWFPTAWFTWGLHIGQGLTFAQLPKAQQTLEVV